MAEESRCGAQRSIGDSRGDPNRGTCRNRTRHNHLPADRYRDDREPLENRETLSQRTRDYRNRTAAGPGQTRKRPRRPRPVRSARRPPLTQFDHLDKDGDGVLNRSEFAQVISPKDSYSKIDTNANGVIEPQEFDAYQEAHRPSN